MNPPPAWRTLPHVESGASAAARRVNWLPLIALGVATVVIANDFSAINVALPTMERDFDTNINTIQWVVNAYALMFGVMIVTGGRLADMFGRRSAFFLGTAIFAAMSLLGGLASTLPLLIVARTLMGVGAALMLPAIIGMVYGLLPEDKAGLAGGIIMGAAGLGNAVGPLIGGALTDLASWRWIFFVNVPAAAFAVAVVWFNVHIEETDDSDHRLDYPGIAAISLGLVALLVALDQVDDWGWNDPRVIFLLVVCALGVGSFAPLERRAGRHALVPPEIIRNRAFAASCVGVLFMSATFFASLLYLPQFMEHQLGYSPLQSGLGMLPALATFALVSFVAGPLYERLGAKVLASVGAACITAAPFLFSLVDAGSGFGALVPGMVVLGIGIGGFYPTATTAGVTRARRVPGQPRRRDRLHVPDRRRLDRVGTDDDGLLRRDPAVRRRLPGGVPARRGAGVGGTRGGGAVGRREAAGSPLAGGG